jgi:hypothetical protein
MKVTKLIALSSVVLSLSVGYGSEVRALVNGDVTQAREAIGTVLIVTGEGNPFDLPPGVGLVN